MRKKIIKLNISYTLIILSLLTVFLAKRTTSSLSTNKNSSYEMTPEQSSQIALAYASPFIASDVSWKNFKRQSEWNEQYTLRMMKEQEASATRQRAQVNAENRAETEYYWDQYNSPAARRAAFEEAGYSPEAALGSSGGSGTASPMGSTIGGTSTPGSSGASFEYIDPVGDILSSLDSASSIATKKLELDELQRAHRYNRDAQGLDLQIKASEARRAQASAVLAEKEAGVFDAREESRIREEQRRDKRLLKDENQFAFDSYMKLLDWSRNRSMDKIRMRREQAEAEGKEQDNRYLKEHGYRPGSGPSLVGTLVDILFPSDSGPQTNTQKGAERARAKIENAIEDGKARGRDFFRSRSEKDHRDQVLMQMAYEHGDRNIKYDSLSRRYSRR